MSMLARIVIVVLLTAAPALLRAEGVRTTIAAAASTITAESSRGHVDALASDAMQGRQTPSAGLDSAAEYIARTFAAAGLEAPGGSWFHHFDLKHEDLDTGNTLSIDGRFYELKNDFIPYDFTASGSMSGEVVFAGYGISLPDSGYDEYAGLDVRGKIVLVVTGEPRRFTTSGYPLRSSWFASTRQKMLTAIEHGAAGIMVVPNPNVSRLLRPTGYPWPALYPMASPGAVRLRLNQPEEPGASIPTISVGAKVAKQFFGSTEGLTQTLEAIDSTGRPRSRAFTARASIATRIARRLVPSRNVMGMLRGRERPDEYVVLGAHYDHVGTRPSMPGPMSMDADTIFNGADDNASGTAALLLTARAFSSLAPADRPSRSILFVAFSAEELGLYGSRAFVANPPVPTSQMVTMLNMDMVGRNNIDTLSVGGVTRSDDLSRVLAEANAPEPFVLLDNIESDFYRSDQAPFARAGVPVLFFHSGDHADYHREGDNPDRVDNAKVARVARLVFRTAWIVGESPARPRATPVDLNDPRAMFIFDR